MPLDFIDLQDHINDYTHDVLLYQKQIKEQTRQAIEDLQRFSSDIQVFRVHGERAQKRVALPVSENPSESISSSSPGINCNIVSVDGSQIAPDPHTSPLLALVNIGIVQFPAGQHTLKPITKSKLYKYKELFEEANLISEDIVNIDRDVMEMEYLKEYSLKTSQPTIALRDGMLELYHEPRSENWYREKVEEYNHYLNELKEHKVITAGYVDKPRSRSLITLINYRLGQPAESNGVVTKFPNITDTHVFSLLLEPTQRSAIFETRVPTKVPPHNQAQKPIFYFFYLNVSQTTKPWIVRVEIPDWVASDHVMVNLLHFSLLEQCAIMGSKPYPYCLHRAHESAVVHQHEKAELESQITSRLMQAGVEMDEKSYKQAAKDLAPHTKMERR